MVTGILKKIIPIAIAGLGIFAVANVIARPQMAAQSATALSSTLGAFGTGLGSIGQGASQFLGGIGTGSAKLLDPLFSLKTLIYGDDAQAVLHEQAASATSTSVFDPVVNTASDQPGVTPSAPSSASVVFPDGSNLEEWTPGVTTVGDRAFNPDYKFHGSSPRVATSSEKSLLSSLTGGLLG